MRRFNSKNFRFSGGQRPSSITDLFNGLNRATGDSFTGGPTTVPDYSGALITPPLNRMGIQGGRLSYNLAEGATLGPELIVNAADRDFSADTGFWSKNGGFIANGVATINGVSTGGIYSGGAGITLSKTYQFTYKIVRVGAGLVRAEIGGSFAPTRSAVGSYTETLTTSIGTTARIYSQAPNTDIDVDNISIREVLPIWLPAETPAHYIRTRKGVVAKYGAAFKGYLNEPARTNKVTCRRHNPTDTSNTLKAGDAAAVSSVVNDAAALATAKLDAICTNGNVYELDNTAGVTSAYMTLSGSVGNLNPHALSVYARVVSGGGVARLEMGGGGGPVSFAGSSQYTRLVSVVTPDTTARSLVILVGAGVKARFILPQMEEGTFATSVIPGDTLATVTRAATVYQRPTAGVLRANDWGVWGRVVPGSTSIATNVDTLLSSYIDNNNYFRAIAYNASVRFGKKVAGVLYEPASNYGPVANTPFEYQMFQSSTIGMGVRTKPDGGNWSAWVIIGGGGYLAPTPLASTYQIGAFNGTLHQSGHYPFTAIIQHSDPKAELERLAARYP